MKISQWARENFCSYRKIVFFVKYKTILILFLSRPGFARVGLPYFMNDKTVDFVLNAVNMVATHGWKLLPQVS